MKDHAEIEQIWPRDGHIRLIGFVHGHPVRESDSWRLLLVLRDHEAEGIQLDYGVELEGRRFDATIRVDELVPARLPRTEKWDLHLVTGTGDQETRLRVGRKLDDIKNKKTIMVFPAQRATGAAGPALVKPIYTIYDNLSIECRPARSPQGAGAK